MQIKLYKSSFEFSIIFCDDVIINLERSTPEKFGEDSLPNISGFVIVNKETKKPWKGATTHTNVPFVDGFYIYHGEKYVHFECEPEYEQEAQDYYDEQYWEEDYYDDDYLTYP